MKGVGGCFVRYYLSEGSSINSNQTEDRVGNIHSCNTEAFHVEQKHTMYNRWVDFRCAKTKTRAKKIRSSNQNAAKMQQNPMHSKHPQRLAFGKGETGPPHQLAHFQLCRGQ